MLSNDINYENKHLSYFPYLIISVIFFHGNN